MSPELLISIVFLPAVWAIPLLCFDEKAKDAMRYWGVLGTALTFFLTLLLWKDFSMASSTMQFRFDAPWVPSWNINFSLGVDGISLPLVPADRFCLFARR